MDKKEPPGGGREAARNPTEAFLRPQGGGFTVSANNISEWPRTRAAFCLPFLFLNEVPLGVTLPLFPCGFFSVSLWGEMCLLVHTSPDEEEPNLVLMETPPSMVQVLIVCM